MNRIIRHFIFLFILFTSCEKIAEQPYTLKFYGDAFEDLGYSVSIVSDGYVIAGQVENVTRDGNFITGRNKNMGIIKTGWNGNTIWEVSVGGKFDDRGTKIYQLEDGSLICTGTFTDTTGALPGQTDILAAKISPSGEIIWKNHYGGAGNQTGQDIVKTPDGFMILGSTDVLVPPATDSTGNFAGKLNFLFLKISDNGDFIDSSTWGYGGNDEGVAIKPDIGGNFIVFGTTERSLPGHNQAKHNLILIRVNNSGSELGSIIIGGTADEYAGDMEVLPDGYLLAATVGKPGENQEIFVTKLKPDIHATPLFTKSIPVKSSSNVDLSASVKAMSGYKTDSWILAGNTGSGSSSRLLILEIDKDGNTVPGHQMIKGSTGEQVVCDVVSGADEYIIAVGKNSYDLNSMICFLKFRF
jgi:hypothetical protein